MPAGHLTLSIVLGALLQLATALPAAAAGELSIPLIGDRGQAAPGQRAADGLADYLRLVNLRDGGVDGLRLLPQTCEDDGDAALGTVCIEHAVDTAAAIALPSPGRIPDDWIERSRAAQVPLLIHGGSRSDLLDGRAFPFVFELSASRLSQAAAQIEFIAMREGGFARLRGKRIAYLHPDDDDGAREVSELLDRLAGDHRFRLTRHAIAVPADGRAARWPDLALAGADWLLLDLPGRMTADALRAARAAGLPAERVIGSAASADGERLASAGEVAIGFIAVAEIPPGANFAVLREIRRHLQPPQGQPPAQPAGPDYLRGVGHGVLIVEAIRLAHRRFGARPLAGEQLRWGLERLRLDDERLAALGAHGLLPPIATSCADHEGSGAVKFQQWLGTRWNVVTDWISGDPERVRRLAVAVARRHAEARGGGWRDCGDD